MATRYPKRGKGRRWTVVELQAINPAWKGDTLADGDGLSGEVRADAEGSVAVRWKYAFRWDNKVNWFQCGTWRSAGQTVPMEEVRSRRDEARNLVKQGVNPNLRKQASRVEAQLADETLLKQDEERRARELPFRAMYEKWLAEDVRRADDNAAIKSAFELHVLPAVGAIAVKDLTRANLLDVLRTIVEKGLNRTAVLISKDLQQMFRWAEGNKPWRGLLVEENPATNLNAKLFVAKDYSVRNIRKRYLQETEIQELAGIYVDSEPLKRTSELATWICLSTLTRIGETTSGEWRHVDFQRRIWLIPAANVKGEAHNKRELLIYLSDFSMRQFTALKALTGGSKWLFPSDLLRKGAAETNHISEKTITKQITDRQVRFTNRSKQLKNRTENDSLVLGNGENGEWTPHDLRRTGATMMQVLKVDPLMIDRCQNHVVQTIVQGHYQHYDYATELREAWDVLGRRLDELMLTVDAQRRAKDQVGLPSDLVAGAP